MFPDPFMMQLQFIQFPLSTGTFCKNENFNGRWHGFHKIPCLFSEMFLRTSQSDKKWHKISVENNL
jgi:hypothetical protein